MGIFRQFPYTNFHDLNLDWFLGQFDDLLKEWAEYHAQWDEWQGDISEQVDALLNWFNNLDVQEEINNKLDEMADNGDLIALIAPYMPWVTPEMFNAVGDGITDDTAAFQNCVNAGKYILCKEDAEYKITDTIKILQPVTIDLNHATIDCTHRHAFYNFDPDEEPTGYDGHGDITIINGTIIGGSCAFAHGENIVIDNMRYYDIINDHMIELCACKNVMITNSIFKGMRNDFYTAKEYINIDPCVAANFPWFNTVNTYDGTPNTYITVDNCFFALGDTVVTAFGEFAFGCHSNGITGLTNHSNIKFTNNIVKAMQTYCLRLNCMDDVIVSGNSLYYKYSYAIQFGSWEVMHNLTIKDNIIYQEYPGAGTYYVYLLRAAGVDGLAIYDNVYDRTGSTRTYMMLFYVDIDANTVFNVIKMEKFALYSLTNTPLPITAFNRLELHVGSVGGGTYMIDNIGCYGSRNFTIGETYPVLYDNAGTPAFDSITVTDDHNFTTSAPVQWYYLSKENTITRG